MTDEELIKDLDSFQKDLNIHVDSFCSSLSILIKVFKEKYNYELIDNDSIKRLKERITFNDSNKQYALNEILSFKNKGK